MLSLAERALEGIGRDITYGMRMLLKNRAFTAAAIVTLGLGIGANSAVFTVVNVVLLRPLPYQDPDRIVLVWNSKQGAGDDIPVSTPDFADLRDESRAFEQFAALDSAGFNLTHLSGEPARVQAFRVSADLFKILGIAPKMGRTFFAEDDRPGAPRAAILSDGLWRSRFNSDPGMVGKMITLNDEDYSVVGVLPPDFQSPFLRADVWVPLSLDLRRGNRGNRFLKVIARLKPDVSREEAAAELNAVARRIEVAHPATNTGFGVRVVRLRDHMVRGSRQALLVLLLTVGFVLLISCSNVANLLLARAALQRRELAVRQALGAARSRIVRQLLTESMILALFGALFGLLLARLSVGALQSAIPSYISDYLPGLKELVIDRRVLGATVILSLLTGLVFGLSPSLLSSATDLTETLKEGAGSTRGRGHSRVRSFLVTSELTLAVVLLVGAALMIRSLGHLVQAGATLDSGNVLTLQFSLPSSRYGQPSERSAFVERVIDRVQSITGVQSVGAVSEVPPSDSFSYSMLSVEGRPPAAPGRQPGVKYHTATPGSFQALGIPLVKGRYFEKWDRSNSPPVAIVNQAMANRFWPGQDALGRRVKLSGPQSSAPWISVVGIVEDVKHSGSDFGEDPELYIPHSQNPDNTMALVVHASHGASNPLPVIESAVKAEDSLLPVYNVRTLKQTLADWSAPHRLITFLMAVFSFIAIVLASVGVYGVAAYSASQRTHEIGIRLALGARGSQIIKLIMKQGLLISGISLVLGLAGAYGLSKAISSLLVDVKPNDPATFMLAALILITLQVVAGYIPAARAAKADPVLALRRENT